MIWLTWHKPHDMVYMIWFIGYYSMLLSYENQIKRAGDNLTHAFSQNLHSKYNGYNGGPYRFHSQNEISIFPQPFFWCSLNGHSQKKFWLWNFFKPPQPKIIYGCGTCWNRHSQKTFGCGNWISSNHSWVLTVNSQSDTVYSNSTEVLKILGSDSKIEVSQIIRDADSFIIKVKVTSNKGWGNFHWGLG